jgi:hypothetical protein
MKKLHCFSLLTLLVLLGNYSTATAQCSDGGSWFTCYSISHNQYIEAHSQDWYADGELYYISVTLSTYSNNDSYAYAEITTPDFYRYDMITEGNLQDDFLAPGKIGGLLRLNTAARNGASDLTASW